MSVTESGFRAVSYDSWSHFKSDFIKDVSGDEYFTPGRFVFRGQQAESWSLTPSFDRTYQAVPLVERPALADSLMERFKRYVNEYEPKSQRLADVPAEHDEIVMMALAQHYGLPTRLLDWSMSPYVACYFAFSDLLMAGQLTDDPDVGIWALDTASQIWRSEMGVRLVDVPRQIDERIRNQGGLFTLATIPVASLEEHHVRMAPDEPALIRIGIPTDQAHVALADLSAMDINHAKLFPGYEGCVRSARIEMASDLSRV